MVMILWIMSTLRINVTITLITIIFIAIIQIIHMRIINSTIMIILNILICFISSKLIAKIVILSIDIFHTMISRITTMCKLIMMSIVLNIYIIVIMFSIIITLILIHIIRTIIIVIMIMHIVVVIILILIILSATAAIIVILMINPPCLDAPYCLWLAAFVLATDRSASFACWTSGFRVPCIVLLHGPLA